MNGDTKRIHINTEPPENEEQKTKDVRARLNGDTKRIDIAGGLPKAPFRAEEIEILDEVPVPEKKQEAQPKPKVYRDSVTVQVGEQNVVLDREYLERVKNAHRHAERAIRLSEVEPLYSADEIGQDIDDMVRCEKGWTRAGVVIGVIALVLGIATVFIPVLSLELRIAICGILVGIAGIFFFSYWMGADRRLAIRLTHRDLCDKYGVSGADEIPNVIRHRQMLAQTAKDNLEKLLKLVRVANPQASTMKDCDVFLESLLRLMGDTENL